MIVSIKYYQNPIVRYKRQTDLIFRDWKKNYCVWSQGNEFSKLSCSLKHYVFKIRFEQAFKKKSYIRYVFNLFECVMWVGGDVATIFAQMLLLFLLRPTEPIFLGKVLKNNLYINMASNKSKFRRRPRIHTYTYFIVPLVWKKYYIC